MDQTLNQQVTVSLRKKSTSRCSLSLTVPLLESGEMTHEWQWTAECQYTEYSLGLSCGCAQWSRGKRGGQQQPGEAIQPAVELHHHLPTHSSENKGQEGWVECEKQKQQQDGSLKCLNDPVTSPQMHFLRPMIHWKQIFKFEERPALKGRWA